MPFEHAPSPGPYKLPIFGPTITKLLSILFHSAMVDTSPVSVLRWRYAVLDHVLIGPWSPDSNPAVRFGATRGEGSGLVSGSGQQDQRDSHRRSTCETTSAWQAHAHVPKEQDKAYLTTG
jgi:hypothetical protein